VQGPQSRHQTGKGVIAGKVSVRARAAMAYNAVAPAARQAKVDRMALGRRSPPDKAAMAGAR